MESQILESRVLAIVDAVRAGRQVEDDRVELKSTWPDAAHKTARQIAGHANTAGGEPILWIIGLDEKSGTFGSTAGVEPANWWSAMQRHFVEVEPDLEHFFSVPVGDGVEVLVLQFATDRAPYVVSVPGDGQVQREIPWRGANSTRTAHRHEMIRSIVAEASVPTLELIGGKVEVLEFADNPDPYSGEAEGSVGNFKLDCALHMFLSAQAPAHLPEHRQTLTIRSDALDRIDLGAFRLKGSYRFDGVAQSGLRRQVPFGNVAVLGGSSVEVNGPGEMVLRVERIVGSQEGAVLLKADEVELELGLPVDRSDRAARLACKLLVPDYVFTERDIPDASDMWHLRKRFTVGAMPHWTT